MRLIASQTPPTFCGCAAPRIVKFNNTWARWVEFNAAYAEAYLTHCCLACRRANTVGGDVGSVDWLTVAALNAREAIGQTGTAATLGLADWSDIGYRIGSELLTEPGPGKRIDVTLNVVPESQRYGILRAALGLPRNQFPRVSRTVLTKLPGIILHDGLALKLGKTTDAAHYRFAKMTLRSVQKPFEVWSDVSKSGARVVRFLNRYRAPVSGAPGVVNHLVVMEEATGIAITQYLRRDAQVLSDRCGTLLYAAWAAPSI